jgi:hypothetical protein
MDLEVQEAILVEELEHDLHPTDGRELSVELDKARTCVDRITASVPPRPSNYPNGS